MGGVSSPEVLMARAVELVEKKEVWYVNTNGNTHSFKGKGHKQHDSVIYEITGEILPNNEIEWACKCEYNIHHDDCKHTKACEILIKTMNLRDEYKGLSSDVDKHYHDDDEVIVPPQYDDEVIGKIKIESDDD